MKTQQHASWLQSSCWSVHSPQKATEEKRAQWDLWRLQQQTEQKDKDKDSCCLFPPRLSEGGPADPSDYLSAGWEKICFSLRALGDWLRPPRRCTARVIGRRVWDNCGDRFVWGAGSPPRRGLVSQSGHGGDPDFHQSRGVRGHAFYSAPRMLMLRPGQKAGKGFWKITVIRGVSLSFYSKTLTFA